MSANTTMIVPFLQNPAPMAVLLTIHVISVSAVKLVRH